MKDNTMEILEDKIKLLIAELRRVSQENELLKNSEQSLMQQRNRLIEKNDIAKSKVESMIHRLRLIDRESYH